MSSVRNFAQRYFFNMHEETFYRIAAILFPLVICYVFLGIFVAEFNHDEFEAIHTAWKMLQGETIFKDFFQHHHQLFYYLLMPFIYFSGETIRTVYLTRIMTFLIYLGILFVTFCFTRRYFSSATAFVALFFLTGLPFVPCAFQIRPDGLMLLMALVGVLFFFRFLEKRNMTDLAISGISLAVSFLVLHKIVILCAALGLLSIYLCLDNSMSWSDLIWYSLFGALPLLIYAFYLTYHDLWDAYITCNWIFNMYQLHTPSTWSYPSDLYTQSHIIMLFFLLGLLFYMRTSFVRYVGYFAVVLLLYVTIIVPVPWIQYYLLPFPFVAMIAAQATVRLCKDNYAQLFVIIFVHLLHAHLGGGHRLIRHGFVLPESIKRAQYVLDVTSKDDYVYGGTATYNLFRRDIHFFWFDAGMKVNSDAFNSFYNKIFNGTYDVYRSIREKKPKTIVTYCLDVTHPAITKKYKKSVQFDGFLMIREEL